MATFIFRALDWRQLNTIAESSRVPDDIFLTDYNEFSWYVKTQIVDRYGDDQPWLKAAWNVTNSSRFIYSLLPNQYGFAVYYGGARPHGEHPHTMARTMLASLTRVNQGNQPNIVHELAHVYTKSNRVVNNPLAIAAAHLYFEGLAKETETPGCIPYEIFADTAPDLIFEIKQSSHYWGMCPILPHDATEEAIEVVRTAFSGTVPQWFYDTFQKSDGSLDLDYEAIWSAVRGIENERSRMVVVYQLRNSFGGYCAAYYDPPSDTPRESIIYLNPGMTDQPWVDGGGCF